MLLITWYTIKLTLRDQDYSDMTIEEIKVIIVITIKDTYSYDYQTPSVRPMSARA